MCGPREYLTKSSKSKTNIIYTISHIWNLKSNANEGIDKNRNIHRHREQPYGYQRGKGGMED